MYEFLLSEVWWMETTITAGITAAATLIAAYIGYNYKIKKIYENAENIANLHEKRRTEHSDLSKEHSDLSKEHSDLSKEHSDLSKEHSDLSKEHQGIISAFSLKGDEISKKCDLIKERVYEDKKTLEKINEILIEEKTKQELRFDNLKEKHQNLITSLNGGVDAFKSIKNEFLRTNKEKVSLEKEIEQLKIEIKKKSNRIEELFIVQSDLRSNNIILNRELKLITNEYNDLLKKYQSMNNPKSENKTRYFGMER